MKRIAEIEEEARRAGLIVEQTHTTRGCHLRIHLRATDGRKCLYHTALTPSDRRGLLNMRSDFRRFARGGL